jgi:Dolichyl-phosphate-mannose-protein mannosyltransferase
LAKRLVLLVIALAALAVSIPAIARLAALLAFPYPHDGLEGTLLYEAQLLRSGEALYQPLERFRFLSAPYPPLHSLLLAAFDLLPGAHVFWGGRLLSTLAAAGVALVAALIVRRVGAAWPVALLAAALVLSAPPLLLWGTRIKPDVLALLFTAAGLWFASRELTRAAITPGANSARPPVLSPALALAAICFVCGFFTKQTAVAGPLAAGIALLAADIRDWHSQPGYLGRLPIRTRTLAFSALYLMLALGVWGLLDLVTGGQYTVHVWWGGERTRWWSFGLFSKIAALLTFWWPQMILAALAIPLAFRQRALFVPASYLLVAPLTILGAGETGSHHNHLLETHLALAIAGCGALGLLLSAPQAGRRSLLALQVGALILAGGQAFQTTQTPAWYAGELAPDETPERFLNFMRNTPGEILADDTGLLFQAGRDLRYDDPSTMGPAAAIGAWDQSGLLEEIAQRKFSAIMIPTNVEESDLDPTGRWTPEMLAAIKQHYQLKFRDRINTYGPRE